MLQFSFCIVKIECCSVKWGEVDGAGAGFSEILHLTLEAQKCAYIRIASTQHDLAASLEPSPTLLKAIKPDCDVKTYFVSYPGFLNFAYLK